MNKCEECRYYRETYPNKGYCKMWDYYVNKTDTCEDFEEGD